MAAALAAGGFPEAALAPLGDDAAKRAPQAWTRLVKPIIKARANYVASSGIGKATPTNQIVPFRLLDAQWP
jgi:hypothetical protein